MEITIEQALQRAVETHKAGNLQDAEALYRAILQIQPNHPDANHNLGVLTCSINKTELALPLFKIALDTNPNQRQFWISYIEALIKLKQFSRALSVVKQGKKIGLNNDQLDVLYKQLTLKDEPSNSNGKHLHTFTQQRKKLSSKKEKKNQNFTNTFGSLLNSAPTQTEINTLLKHYQTGKHLEAEQLARYITQKYPNHEFAWRVMAELLSTSGLLEDLLLAHQKIVTLSPNNAEAYNNLGNTLKSIGRPEEARNSFRQALAIKPTFTEAHYNLGNTLNEIGLLEEAESHYKLAIVNNPDFAEAYCNLAHTLHQLGRLNEAVEHYKQAVTLKPDFAVAYYNYGNILKELYRFSDAEKSFKKAIEFKKDFAEAYYNLGNTLKELDKLEEAKVSYKQAIEFKNNYADAYYSLGNTLRELGLFEEAEENFRKAISIKPSFAEAHCNLALTLNQLGRAEEAETGFRQAILLQPNFAQAHYNLGNSLKTINRFEDAETSYKQAILLKPDFAEAHASLALTLHTLGRFEDAENSFKYAIEFKPNFAEAYCNLGNTFKELKKFEDAEISYKKAITIKPDFAEAFSNLGVMLYQIGSLDEAEINLKQAIQQQPEFAEAFFNLSLVCIFSNQLEESIRYLKKVIEIDSGSLKQKATVTLSILFFLKDDFSHTSSLLKNDAEILQNKSKLLTNEKNYIAFLNSLLNWHHQQGYQQKQVAKLVLYVIGESHSLSSHGLFINNLRSAFLCKAQWIVGCKQWHIGNNRLNQYKEKLRRVIDSVPDGSKILLAIGEIDCRLDEGILKHIRNYPEKSQSELIQSTVENYLNYVHQLTIPKSLHVIIQGVPCPNIDTHNVEQSDLLQLINLIREFNKVLQDGTIKRNFDFLDLHKLTDRGDGFSNGLWHIDQHHLSPAGMIEAWRRHFE